MALKLTVCPSSVPTYKVTALQHLPCVHSTWAPSPRPSMDLSAPRRILAPHGFPRPIPSATSRSASPPTSAVKSNIMLVKSIISLLMSVCTTSPKTRHRAWQTNEHFNLVFQPWKCQSRGVIVDAIGHVWTDTAKKMRKRQIALGRMRPILASH